MEKFIETLSETTTSAGTSFWSRHTAPIDIPQAVKLNYEINLKAGNALFDLD